MTSATISPAGPRVIIVSHGFQKHYECDFANALARNQVHVELIGSDASERERLLPGVTFLNLRGSQSPYRSRWRKLLNLCRYHGHLLWHAARNRNACVHVIGLLTPVVPVAILENLLLRLLSRRLIVTVHDVLPHERHTRWNRLLFRLAYRLPTLLVVHSESARAKLVSQFGVVASRVVVIEHGINERFADTQLDRADARRHLGIEPHRTVLLFFGSWGQYKGIDLLAEAVSGLSQDALLLVVGKPGTPEYQRHIEALVATKLAPGRARLWPRFVDNEEIPYFFLASDLCVLPYRHVDQSGVLFLALTFGIPLLATDVGSFRHYICPAVGIVVPPDDAVALRAGIEQWLAARDSFDALAIREYGRRFEWAQTVAPLLSRYAA